MAKRKTYKWIENVDGTDTLRLTVDGKSVEITKIWRDDVDCARAVDLFIYFGIDSAVAGRPVKSDLDRIAAREAEKAAVAAK